ncbi:hypothetical protein DAEQUDRAFT_810395 [Daedalea quercina L-15889]|uniref:F-box domain-containing protein n=1 Tax=Daedalea quercina L-15889 TaxID=1314783 RepID=A0A165RIQ0_9APHY|nr:hypothetical protein DAEQUDRAFT_810395 [Daedalea quercina L-15889]
MTNIAESSAQSASIFKLPPEILFEILSLLDVSDLLRIRETCMRIEQLSKDRSVWLRMLLTQRSRVPIPPPYNGDITNATRALSCSALSRLVLSIYYIEGSWLLPRPLPIPLGPPEQSAAPDVSEQGGNTAIFMDVVADHWLVAVYNEGSIHIWDLYVDGITPVCTYRRAGLTPEPKCRFNLKLPVVDSVSSASVGLSQDTSTLHILVVSQTDCTVLDVQLPTVLTTCTTGAYELRLNADHAWKLPRPNFMARALHAASKLAFFSYSDTLVLLQWEIGKIWQLRTVDEPTEEEFWTLIIAARFISPYHIICVKTRTVELLTLPSTFLSYPNLSSTSDILRNDENIGHLPTKILYHFLSGLNFRGVSMSEAEVSSDGVRISFLAYDILQGLFHYRVSLLLSPSTVPTEVGHDGPPSYMAVRLLAVHRLAQLHSTAAEGAANMPRSRSGFTPGSRAFVSACILGRTGRRGVWIERRRGSMRRSVIAFSTAADAPDEEGSSSRRPGTASGGDDVDQRSGRQEEQDWMSYGEVRPIDGRVIFEVNSYDLHEDITHCALAESTGTVILGNRRGDLKLL